MAEPFHKRFDIDIPLEEGRRRFRNRIRILTLGVIETIGINHDLEKIMRRVKVILGEEHEPFISRAYNFMNEWDDCVGDNWQRLLKTTEAVCSALRNFEDAVARSFDKAVKSTLAESEIDLGISWDSGVFTRTGAKLLDERLVNDPLHWLRERKYDSVLSPYEKGLKHLIEGEKNPERYADAITDAYEALEALAKIVTGQDRDLAGNSEKFISALELPEAYRRMLKEYISFGNLYRHAPRTGKERDYPTLKDTEAFVYMTGLFIRLAIQSTKG